MQQLAYDYISNKNNPFSAFLLGYLTKKVYIFLYDRIDGTFNQRSATDIFKKLSDETELILSQSKQEVIEGLHQTAKFLLSCFQTNSIDLGQIKAALETLPYQQCLDHKPEADRLLALPVKLDFKYEHLIDPAEISAMQEEVIACKDQLDKDTQFIRDFADALAPVFEQIETVKQFTALELAQMNQTKTEILDPVGNDLYFTIGIFDEGDQERYMNKHKAWLQSVQKHIEQELSLQNGLTDLVQTIIQTELLTLTAGDLLENDQALLFLLNRERLAQKLQELLNAVQTLNGIIEKLNELPRQRAEEFAKKMALLLYLSLLPLCNICVLFPISALISKYQSGLDSQNPFYVELRENQNKKFRLFCYIHLALTLSGAAASFVFVPADYRNIGLGIAFTYLVTAFAIYLKGKKFAPMA